MKYTIRVSDFICKTFHFLKKFQLEKDPKMGQVCQENLEREIMNSFRFRPSSSPWHLSLHPRRLLLSPNHPGAASRPEGRFGQAELSRIGPPPAGRPTCLDRFLQIHLQDHGRQSRWHQCELELNEFRVLSFIRLCNIPLYYTI